MKKMMISLAIAAIAMFSTANAQETVSEVVVPTKKDAVITNSYGSNWFLGVNGGVNLYNGVKMNGETIFDHVSPALDIYFGKWHTPGFGWRVAYRGLNIHTFKDLDHTTFMNFHIDMMINLCNLFGGYREDRVWNVIPYVGVGWAGRKGFDTDNSNSMTSGTFTGTLSANYGILQSFRVAKRWAINLELAGTFFRNGFSSIPGWSGHDMMWTATAGVTYNIGRVGWDNAVDVPALQAIYTAALGELMSDLENAQAENAKLKKDYNALKNEYDKLNNAYNELKNRPNFIDVKESVFFAFGSSKIASKKEQMNIEAYAKAAAEAGLKLRVIGYTDVIGAEEYNKTLAADRANAVAEVLKAAGVKDVEVVVVGESEEYSTKYLNRRAVIEIAK